MTNRKIWSRISTYLDLPPERLLSGNPINNYIYDTILEVSEAASFPNPQNPGFHIKRYALKGVTPPDILNEAYYQCAKIVGDPNPEVDFYSFIEADIRDNVHDRKDYVPLVFSVMYVLFSHMNTTPVRVRRVLHLLDKKLEYDLCYFPAFKKLIESFKKDKLHFVVNLNPRCFSMEDDNCVFFPWDEEYDDLDVAVKTVLSSNDKVKQLNYIEKRIEDVQSDPQPNMSLVNLLTDMKRSIEYDIVKYHYSLPLSDENTKDTSPDEIIARLNHRIEELTGTDGTSEPTTKEVTSAQTSGAEEGAVQIKQLIDATVSFPPEEADVILRFLQTFVASESGDVMQQIKAAQKNLEARKSSIPVSGEGFKSTIKINEKKFAKIDLIRIINAMYDIGFFASTEGKKKIKGQCMVTIGNALNVDLGDYSNDLSSSMQDGSKIDKHLEIFKLMADAMEDYFNNR